MTVEFLYLNLMFRFRSFLFCYIRDLLSLANFFVQISLWSWKLLSRRFLLADIYSGGHVIFQGFVSTVPNLPLDCSRWLWIFLVFHLTYKYFVSSQFELVFIKFLHCSIIYSYNLYNVISSNVSFSNLPRHVK